MRSYYANLVLFVVIEFLRFSTYKTSITLLFKKSRLANQSVAKIKKIIDNENFLKKILLLGLHIIKKLYLCNDRIRHASRQF